MTPETYSSRYFRKSGLCFSAGETKPHPSAAVGGPVPLKRPGCVFREIGAVVRGTGHLTGLDWFPWNPERLFWKGRALRWGLSTQERPDHVGAGHWGCIGRLAGSPAQHCDFPNPRCHSTPPCAHTRVPSSSGWRPLPSPHTFTSSSP